MQQRSPRPPAKQSGVMLLEALLALLIFSMGILAIVGMQATAVQDMGEAKYRTDAAFLANQIIADMWSNSTNLADYEYGGSGAPPAQIHDWAVSVQDRLPGVSVASGSNLPIIELGPDNSVSVTVRWQQGRDVGADAHSYRTVAYINCCL
jgi:type IV pilus assembly protein PilV